MNPKTEHELEALIDRELKALPPLNAPPALAARILNTLAERAAAPWYRQAWTSWPLALRVASFVLLAGAFTGLCLFATGLSQSEAFELVRHKLAGAFSLVELAGRTLNVLRDAVAAVISHVGTGFVLALAAVVFAAYAVCVALGSACLRFAFIRR